MRQSSVRIDLAPIPESHKVEFFALTPDSENVVFISRFDAIGNLWVTPIDGSTPAVKLSGVMPANYDVRPVPVQFGSGPRVVFLRATELRSGSTAPRSTAAVRWSAWTRVSSQRVPVDDGNHRGGLRRLLRGRTALHRPGRALPCPDRRRTQGRDLLSKPTTLGGPPPNRLSSCSNSSVPAPPLNETGP